MQTLDLLANSFFCFFFFFLKLQQPLQTIWHTKAAANGDHNDDKNENPMMIKFYPVLSGQWADKCTCWQQQQQQQKRQLLLLRPWKEETEKEQQQRREKNKNRSDKFVDLSKAKADQEMQASRKKNKPKLVFVQAKKETARECVYVCGLWANGYHVSGTWLKLKYSVISAKKVSWKKNQKNF